LVAARRCVRHPEHLGVRSIHAKLHSYLPRIQYRDHIPILVSSYFIIVEAIQRAATMSVAPRTTISPRLSLN
jgi:hypothetical protein